MGERVDGSWVHCALGDAREGNLPPISVASGESTSYLHEAWVQIGAGLSVNAAAAGRIGVRTTHAKLRLPMTEQESRRVPKKGVAILLATVIVGVWTAFGLMLLCIGLFSSLPEDQGALGPGVAVFGSGVAVLVAAGRWRYNRARWGRARIDHRTGDLLLYVHPTFATALAAHQAV